MIIYQEISLYNFEAWSGGVDTLDRVINAGKVDELESLLDELYPEGLSDTELNDILWFEDEWIYQTLGIRTESEIREELEEVQDELDEIMDNFLDETEEMEDDEKESYWKENYAFDYEQMEERIKELEEELDNI